MSDEDPYEPLYAQYKRELRGLYDTLTKERRVVVKEIMEDDGLSEADAMEQFYAENGPLVHDGRATHLIRKYWLEIARLKNEREPIDEDFLEPLTFLVEDLIDDDEDELVAFLTEIAYWPIGLDESNEWT